jgi:hypothetical protein
MVTNGVNRDRLYFGMRYHRLLDHSIILNSAWVLFKTKWSINIKIIKDKYILKNLMISLYLYKSVQKIIAKNYF